MGKDKRNLWQNIVHNSVRSSNESVNSSQASGFSHSSKEESQKAAIAARKAEMNKTATVEKKNGIPS